MKRLLILILLVACTGSFHYTRAIIGDSRVYGGYWEQFGICNHGQNGDSTAGVLGRLKELTDHVPKLDTVYSQVGRNDLLFYGRTVEETFTDYKAIIDTLRAWQIKIVVLSTIPDGGSNPEGNKLITQLNSMLIDYCEQVGVDYIDINKELAPNGFLIYTDDEIHPNQQGYQILYEIIERI